MKFGVRLFVAALLCMAALLPTSAETIVLPADLLHIEAEAFAGDASVTAAIVPEGTLSIGSRAFAGSGLTEITLPRSLTSIADDAFEDCGELTVVAPEGSYAAGWAAAKGLNVEASFPFTYHDDYGELTITGYTGTDEIVTVPDAINGVTVEFIGAEAFRGNAEIRSVVLPDTITSVGHRSFEGCANLESIRMPSALTSIGGYAFKDCAALTEIEIPAKVAFIGNGAFDGCTALAEIAAGIGENGATVISLYGLPFADAQHPEYRLLQYTTDRGELSLGVAQYLGGQESVGIPGQLDGVAVTRIESLAFAGSAVGEIELSGEIAFIADDAFEGCEGITLVVPENSYAHTWCGENGVTFRLAEGE